MIDRPAGVESIEPWLQPFVARWVAGEDLDGMLDEVCREFAARPDHDHWRATFLERGLSEAMAPLARSMWRVVDGAR